MHKNLIKNLTILLITLQILSIFSISPIEAYYREDVGDINRLLNNSYEYNNLQNLPPTLYSEFNYLSPPDIKIIEPKNSSGDWIIDNTEIYKNRVIVVSGNIIIKPGGKLILENTTILINCMYYGEWQIRIEYNGVLKLLKGSVISSVDPRYKYYLYVFGTLIARNSVISNVGSPSVSNPGFVVKSIYGVSIHSSVIEECDYSIYIVYSENVSISGSDLKNIDLIISDSENIFLSNFSIIGSINVFNSKFTLHNSRITGTLSLYESGGSHIIGNKFIDGGVYISGESIKDYIHDIRNNLVNSKELYYLLNESNTSILGYNVGQIIIVKSENISIRNVEISKVDHGIQIYYSTNIVITDSVLSWNQVGISIFRSRGVEITKSIITHNSMDGILLSDSERITIMASTISFNGCGIEQSLMMRFIQGNVTRVIWSSTSGAPQIEIHYSNITRNRYLGLEAFTAVVNATYNWWGSPNGPVLNMTGDQYDPEEIYGEKVLYRPWLQHPIYIRDNRISVEYLNYTRYMPINTLQWINLTIFYSFEGEKDIKVVLKDMFTDLILNYFEYTLSDIGVKKISVPIEIPSITRALEVGISIYFCNEGICVLKDSRNITLYPSIMLFVPYEFQWDTAWCGPASLAMVLRYYGFNIHMWDIAEFLRLSKDEGTLISDLTYYLDNFYSGLKVKIGRYKSVSDGFKSDIISNLTSGYPVIVLVPKHYIVVTGYNEEGVFINDPSGWFIRDVLNITEYMMKPTIQVFVRWSDFLKYVTVKENSRYLYEGSTLVIYGDPNPPYGSISINTMGHSARAINILKNRYIYLELDHGLSWIAYNHTPWLTKSDILFLLVTCFNNIYYIQSFKVVTTVYNLHEDPVLHREIIILLRPFKSKSCLIDIPLRKYLSSGLYYIEIKLIDSGGDILDSIRLKPILYEPTGTMMKFISEDDPIYFHVYDTDGNHIGLDYGSNKYVADIPGSWYYINENGTMYIYLPMNISRIRYLIDGNFLNKEYGDYVIIFQYMDHGRVMFERSSRGTIYKNKYILMDASINHLNKTIDIYAIPPKATIISPKNEDLILDDRIIIKWIIERGSYEIESIKICMDDEWIDVSNRRSYLIEDMSLGRHVIRLMITDSNGSTYITEVRFIVIDLKSFAILTMVIAIIFIALTLALLCRYR
ncbi:hypothetical protein DRN87_03995 [Candidatus Geothermarchaeota archaeon]|nr:MAG: hypothetical protein DRN87_03995 [Candidatus Geothermarchaeota archaeon]